MEVLKRSLLDGQNRRFLFSVAAACFLLLLLPLAFALFFQNRFGYLLLCQKQALASSLLEDGVSGQTLAKAFSSREITPEGIRFLEQIGHAQNFDSFLLPFLGQATIRTALFSLLMLALPLFLLATGALRYFSRRQRLLEEAVAVVRRYAEGDFSVRLPGDQTGSLFVLFDSVNRLSTALKSRNESLHQAREFLRDTVSDISHQLKTPLSALHLYAEIILNEPDRPQTVSEFAQKSLLSLERTQRLIGLLLKVMRLDSGSVTFEKRRCSVSELAETAVQDFRTRAGLEGKSLILQGNPDETVFCDPHWTREAISNLVKNALDHTPEGGTVRVSWERSPAMLRLLVEDDGCGIPQEDLPHIFKRFYTGSGGGKAVGQQGVGLGLPLARAIAEGQGGLLSVSSRTGQGTRFTLSFLTES